MPNAAMSHPIDPFTLLVMGLLLPLLQLVSLIALLCGFATYNKCRVRLHWIYAAMLVAIAPWITYATFSLILLNLWNTNPTTHWAIVLWAGLAIANRIVLPLTIGLACLPPYPPQAWLPTVYRLSAIGMAIVAHHLTQQVFPIAP
jgi:hypothetical protein